MCNVSSKNFDKLMTMQKQGDQLEPTYSSSVRIRCSPEDVTEAMNDRERWRERVREGYPGMTRDDDDDDDYARRSKFWKNIWVCYSPPPHCSCFFLGNLFSRLNSKRISFFLLIITWLWCTCQGKCAKMKNSKEMVLTEAETLRGGKTR